jgi:hypothetical protein
MSGSEVSVEGRFAQTACPCIAVYWTRHAIPIRVSKHCHHALEHAPYSYRTKPALRIVIRECWRVRFSQLSSLSRSPSLDRNSGSRILLCALCKRRPEHYPLTNIYCGYLLYRDALDIAWNNNARILDIRSFAQSFLLCSRLLNRIARRFTKIHYPRL